MFELTRLSPYSHLLKVNGASILLDCGSDSLVVEESYLTSLSLLAPTLNLILLSSGSLEYCGLLPFLRDKGAVCPIYATLATREMGRFTLQEWAKRRTEEEGTVQLPSTAFDRVTPIRFTQPIHLTGLLKGFTLVAHPSGHSLGSSFFTLRPSLSSNLDPSISSESLLYSPVFNHLKQHHLDGTSLLDSKTGRVDPSFKRIGLFITGTEKFSDINLKRIDRDKALLDLVTKTLSSSRSLLLPTDPSTRLLEILFLLQKHWTHSSLTYPLCLVSSTGKRVTEFVRSLTEFFREGSEGVLTFPNLQIFPSLAALNLVHPPSTPKLILITPPSLSYGASLELFTTFTSVPGNQLVLLEKPAEEGVGKEIFEIWNKLQEGNKKWGGGEVGRSVRMDRQVNVEVRKRVLLEGTELEEFLESKRLEEETAARNEALAERSRRMVNASNSDSESDEEDIEDAGEVAEKNAGAWDEFLPKEIETGKLSFDIYVKNSRGRNRMFPLVERKRRVDLYGESIDIKGWLERNLPESMILTSSSSIIHPIRSGAGAAISSDELNENGKRPLEEEEEIDPELLLPHKFVRQKIIVSVQCGVWCCDMEGKSDGKAIRRILGEIAPRRLVLLGDSPNAQALKSSFDLTTSTKDGGTEVNIAELNIPLTIGEEIKSFEVRLGDTLFGSSGLGMARVDDYDLTFLSGTLTFPSVPSTVDIIITAVTVVPTLEKSSLEQHLPIIQSDSSNSPGSQLNPLKPTLFIGSLILTSLKSKLQSLQPPILSTFSNSGALICSTGDQVVLVKKESSLADKEKAVQGRLIIEGGIGELFWRVRKQVYSMGAMAG